MYEYGIINYNECLYAFNPEFVRRIALFLGGSVKKFFSFRLFLLCTFIIFSLLSFSSCTQSIFRPAAETTDTIMTEGVSDILDTPYDTDVFVPQVTDETSAQETTETLPPEPEIRSASFVGVGDIIIYYGNVRDAKSQGVPGGRTYNFAPLFKNVSERISSADIAFVNQETLMCGDGYEFSYYPHFNGPQDLGYDIKEAGFDVVNIANNHMLDKGENGLLATIDFWNSLEGITLIGGYKDQTDYDTLRIVERNGVRIAFLSYTFFTNYLSLPDGAETVIPYFDDETAMTQLSRARELADFVIVSVHWDAENTFTPTQIERDFSRLLADNGADAIIGHHPHVIQPVEWIDRADGGRTLCVYSLGNFAAEQAKDYNMLGGMISFDMVLTDGTPSIENVKFIPTVYYFDTSFYQNQVYYLSDFTEEMANSHGISYYGNSLSLDTLKKYLSDTIDSRFLGEP